MSNRKDVLVMAEHAMTGRQGERQGTWVVGIQGDKILCIPVYRSPPGLIRIKTYLDSTIEKGLTYDQWNELRKLLTAKFKEIEKCQKQCKS